MMRNTRSPAQLITAAPITYIITTDLNEAQAKVKTYLAHLTTDTLSEGLTAFTAACKAAQEGGTDLLVLAGEQANVGEQLNPDHHFIAYGKKENTPWNAPIHFQKFPKINDEDLMLMKISRTSHLSDRLHILNKSFGQNDFESELEATLDFIQHSDTQSTIPQPRKGTKVEATSGTKLLSELNKLLTEIKAQYKILAKPENVRAAEIMLLNNLNQDVAAFQRDLPAVTDTEEAHIKTKREKVSNLSDKLKVKPVNITEVIALIKDKDFIAAITAENVSTYIYNIFSTTPSKAFLNRLNTEVDYYEQRMTMLNPPKITVTIV